MSKAPPPPPPPSSSGSGSFVKTKSQMIPPPPPVKRADSQAQSQSGTFAASPSPSPSRQPQAQLHAQRQQQQQQQQQQQPTHAPQTSVAPTPRAQQQQQPPRVPPTPTNAAKQQSAPPPSSGGTSPAARSPQYQQQQQQRQQQQQPLARPLPPPPPKVPRTPPGGATPSERDATSIPPLARPGSFTPTAATSVVPLAGSSSSYAVAAAAGSPSHARAPSGGAVPLTKSMVQAVRSSRGYVPKQEDRRALSPYRRQQQHQGGSSETFHVDRTQYDAFGNPVASTHTASVHESANLGGGGGGFEMELLPEPRALETEQPRASDAPEEEGVEFDAMAEHQQQQHALLANSADGAAAAAAAAVPGAAVHSDERSRMALAQFIGGLNTNQVAQFKHLLNAHEQFISGGEQQQQQQQQQQQPVFVPAVASSSAAPSPVRQMQQPHQEETVIEEDDGGVIAIYPPDHASAGASPSASPARQWKVRAVTEDGESSVCIVDSTQPVFLRSPRRIRTRAANGQPATVRHVQTFVSFEPLGAEAGLVGDGVGTSVITVPPFPAATEYQRGDHIQFSKSSSSPSPSPSRVLVPPPRYDLGQHPHTYNALPGWGGGGVSGQQQFVAESTGTTTRVVPQPRQPGEVLPPARHFLQSAHDQMQMQQRAHPHPHPHPQYRGGLPSAAVVVHTPDGSTTHDPALVSPSSAAAYDRRTVRDFSTPPPSGSGNSAPLPEGRVPAGLTASPSASASPSVTRSF